MKKEDIEKVINESLTMSEVATKLGVQFSTFKRHAIKYGLYKPNQGGKGTHRRKIKGVIPLKEILEGKHPYFQTYKLKQRMLREGLLKNKCDICGFEGEWFGKQINMILDHIDGNRSNHAKNNLRMVCPMCDSQLSTFKSKNIKRVH